MTSPAPGECEDRPAGAGGEPEAPVRPGGWLRQQRQARGWAQPEMARRLREAARQVDDELPKQDSLVGMVRRWERGFGVSERYRLHFCRAFGVPAGEFGTGQPGPPAAGPAPAGTLLPVTAVPPGRPVLAPPAAVACRGSQEPGLNGSWIMREVLMAAHEGSEHAVRAEEHGIGEATFGQLRADVVRLSRLTDTGEPFAVFLDLRRVRERACRLLERRLWPREQAGLHLLAGCLNALMSAAARRLGYLEAAAELSRAGWAHASAVDHRPLLAHLRWQLSYVEYWRGRTRQSRDLAASGLEYQSAGPGGAELHLQHARAAARLGDADQARQAVNAAHDARDHDYHDDLLEIGGDFAVSRATHHCSAGMALAEVRGAESQAAGELEQAISLYDAGPGPGEEYWVGGRALAGIDLATIRLKAGALDAASAALDDVFSLAPAQRVSQITLRIGLVRAELAAPIFRGSAPARELDERIEEFCRQTVVTDPHSLPGG